MDGKIERIELRASGEFLKAIDEWRRKQLDLPSRSSAIRQLVEKALENEVGKPAGKKK
jgi:metal-responsive CopG/Arc/MetJ family transcriptional regulator